MITDFTITIQDVLKPMAVRVVVHDNLCAMRSAVTQSDNRRRYEKNEGENNDYLAICQRMHMSDSPVYSIVRFAPPNIGAGIIAHEMAHAAVWLWHIKTQFKDVPLDCENDEWFAWILGELVRRVNDHFHEKGAYESSRDP